MLLKLLFLELYEQVPSPNNLDLLSEGRWHKIVFYYRHEKACIGVKVINKGVNIDKELLMTADLHLYD